MKKPIGIFDSGFGGLTVFSELRKLLPREDIVYFGDTARVPYGSKSKEVVTGFSLQIADFLIKQKVKMIVVACNTASAFALPALQKKFRLPVFGVIQPGAEAALRTSKKKRIGVIGTAGTIRSASYDKAIRSLDKKTTIFSKACPLFVPLIEEGWIDHPVTKAVAKEYLAPLAKKGIDVMVLGCTHYPLIKKVIREIVDGNISLIDSAEATAADVRNILDRYGLLEKGGSAGKYRFYVSDYPEKFKKLGRMFLGHPVTNVKRVLLD